jgi:heme/copper-type cytochrome/quinol oxidase subunit 2
MPSGLCVVCPYPLRCLGGDECAEGAIGVGCGTCGVKSTQDVDTSESWEEQLLGLHQDDTIKYYNSYGTCRRCPTEGVILPVVVVLISVSVGMLILFRLTTVSKTVDTEATQGAIKVLGSTATIAFGHLQMAVHILTLPSVQWPELLQAIMQFLRNIAFISFADFVRPECQVPGGMDPELEFFLKYALKQLVFAVLFGVFLAVYILGRVRAGTTGGLGTQYHGTNAMVALYSVFFLLLVQSNFAIWDCTYQEAVLEGSCTDGVSTTEADCPCDETWTDPAPATYVLDEFPEMECYGNAEGLKRTVWLGVAMFSAISLIMYVVVLPVYFLRKLRSAKQEDTLTDYEMKAQYGWLFTRYSYNACTYFEFLFMARKATVVLLGMFISNVENRRLMLVLTGAVLATALALNLCLRPYSDHDLIEADTYSDRSWSSMDVLDSIGLTCSLICLACAVYFVGDCTREGGVETCIKREEGENMTFIVSLIALVCALGPIGLSLWSVCRARKKKREQAVEFGEFENPVEDDDE